MSQKISIYYVRHGQTYFNLKDYIQGQCDAPLTQKGLEVAKKLGEMVKHIPFQRAYSSDLRRAMETLDIILEKHTLEPTCSKLLRELNFGLYEGDIGTYFWRDMSQKYGFNLNDMSFMERYAYLYHPTDNPTGEKLDDFINRLKEAFQEIVEAATIDNHQDILVVGHGLAIHAILEAFGVHAPENSITNSSVSKIVYENHEFKVEYFGREEGPF